MVIIMNGYVASPAKYSNVQKVIFMGFLLVSGQNDYYAAQ